MGGMTDFYGYEVSTSKPEAAKIFADGSRSFVGWYADAMGLINGSIDADPDFVTAKLLKAWILHSARTEKFRPVVDGLLAEVKPHLGGAPARDQALARAIEVAGRSNLQGGVSLLEAYLAENPTDILVHRLAQFELFWSGEARWMRDIAERAAPAWNEDTPDYAQFLAVRAFSNEEAGDYETSERCGRGAVEREPESAWGAHAVAHTLVMQARADDGAAFLEPLSNNWGRSNQIAHHCWWHLCLFLLEQGKYDRILETLDTKVRNPESPLVKAMPDATIDLQNVASLLTRLELRGVDVGDRWHTIAEICGGRVHDHANPFSSAHDAMVLAAAGRFDLIDTLIDSMQKVDGGQGPVAAATRIIGVPLVEAMAAHRSGDHNKVVDLLWTVRRDMHQVGGSHAQRDVFFQVLIDSAMRAGRKVEVAILLDDVASIGFKNVAERSLYRDAAASLH